MPGFGRQKQQLPEYPHQAKDERVLVPRGCVTLAECYIITFLSLAFLSRDHLCFL